MYWNELKEDGFPEHNSEVLVYTIAEEFWLVYFFEDVGFISKRKGFSRILHQHGYSTPVRGVTHWKELVVPLVDEDDEDDLDSIS